MIQQVFQFQMIILGIQMKMEKEKIETQLQELQDIKDQKGEVKAPVAGVVTAIDAQVGARTAGTGDIRLADASAGAGYGFPSEYESYKRGQPVEVTDKKKHCRQRRIRRQN